MNAILSLAMGYFVGCINPAAWVGKKKHVDLKQSGTGNLGATNTALVLGKNAGYFVLFFDIFKSFFSYKAARLLFPRLAATAGLLAGIGVLLGIQSELVSMLIFGVVWALLISRINRSGRSSADTTISVFSSTGIALGLLILSRDGSFSRYSSLLVGDVLAIRPDDIVFLGVALIAGLILWAMTYNKLLLTAVSPQLAQSLGVKEKWVEYLFVSMVAVAVMLSIRWVGVLLINALLILPAAAARNVSRSSARYALTAVLIGLLSGVGGLVLAYYLNTGVGAAVVLCAACCYFISLPVGRWMKIR